VTPAGTAGPHAHNPVRSGVAKNLSGGNPPRFRMIGLSVTTQEEAHGRRHQDGGDEPQAEKGEKDHPLGRGPMTTAVP
jgi:hypothetical protein